ncbi:hypothetical protein HKCCE3408_18395 [Rhodobacterales bacterium HKCCE3408]|nr:hypothetical protein [Rhodobacterales bacterium HKCCE3408]
MDFAPLLTLLIVAFGSHAALSGISWLRHFAAQPPAGRAGMAVALGRRIIPAVTLGAVVIIVGEVADVSGHILGGTVIIVAGLAWALLKGLDDIGHWSRSGAAIRILVALVLTGFAFWRLTMSG